MLRYERSSRNNHPVSKIKLIVAGRLEHATFCTFYDISGCRVLSTGPNAMIMASYSLLNLPNMSSAPSYASTDPKDRLILSERSTEEHQPSNDPPDGNWTRPSHYEISEWLWELLAWLLSTLTFAGTVILLKKFNRSPTTDWHQNIQLSTVVAVLAQVTQSALL